MILAPLTKHITILAPIILPFLFVAIDWMLKTERGRSDFELLGADACLAGCSLFMGSLLGKILSGSFSDKYMIGSCFLLSIALIIVWWSCIALGCKTFPLKKGSKFQPALALFVGGLSLYISVISSWEILS